MLVEALVIDDVDQRRVDRADGERTQRSARTDELPGRGIVTGAVETVRPIHEYRLVIRRIDDNDAVSARRRRGWQGDFAPGLTSVVTSLQAALVANEEGAAGRGHQPGLPVDLEWQLLPGG